jgi:hypothetical protein
LKVHKAAIAQKIELGFSAAQRGEFVDSNQVSFYRGGEEVCVG